VCNTIKDGTNTKPIFSTLMLIKTSPLMEGYRNNTAIFSTTDPDKDFVFNARTQEKYNFFPFLLYYKIIN